MANRDIAPSRGYEPLHAVRPETDDDSNSGGKGKAKTSMYKGLTARLGIAAKCHTSPRPARRRGGLAVWRRLLMGTWGTWEDCGTEANEELLLSCVRILMTGKAAVDPFRMFSDWIILHNLSLHKNIEYEP